MRSTRINRELLTGWLSLLLAVALNGASGRTAEGAGTSVCGRAFDAAPFGFAAGGENGKTYRVRWAEPRKIRRVVVEFREAPGAPDTVRLQYWHREWDGRPDRIVAEAGAGGVGWTRMDDWTNGQWKNASLSPLPGLAGSRDGRWWTFTFAPTGEKEFKDLGHPGVTYRKTLEIRLLGEQPLPKVARFHAFTDAVCQPLTVRIFWGQPAEPSLQKQGDDAGRLEAYNGTITALRQIVGGQVTVQGSRFQIPAGAQGGIEADLLMAVDPADSQYDRTIVTVRSGTRPFSFAADEVARGDRILVDDLGVLVVRGDDMVTLEGYRQVQKEFPGTTVYDRVAGAGEQTLSRAWNDMPIKRALWFVHGLPGNRNAMRQEANGDVEISNVGRRFGWFKSPKDSERKGWKGDWLRLCFGFPAHELRGGRELQDGYLPRLRTWWQEGPLYYEQTTVLDKLDPDLSDIHLDDPTVLLMRVRIVNTSASSPATARLQFASYSKSDEKEELVVEGDRALVQSPGGPLLRYLIQTSGRGTMTRADDGAQWSLELSPGESHELLFTIPSITLTDDGEIEDLRQRDFDAGSRRVCGFWQRLTARGTQIDTPEPWLNDFYKSHLRHLLVSCLQELNSQRLHAHVGTLWYGVYCNESVMMASDLDRRGYHAAAERCLQTWLDYQGTVPLPGNFKSTDGLFYGSGGSEAVGYNKHHGYVMWGMAQHWWFTRDRRWMEQAAPKLIEACEWVIRERRSTMRTNADGSRAIEYGFLPSGGLEDVQDYWYWLATNAATVWGFDALAAALADYGHPQAPRLVEEARAYHEDVVAGLTESRIRAPVVRLRDRAYVPKFPSRLYQRGRCYGWIRETLEGAIFLPVMGLVAPEGPETEWIMKDYEDNLYISNRYGYSIPVFDRFWFSRGGFSMQANLLDSPMPYLYRDEIKHYLRAYFNAFASAFYPETRMCNEHSLPELGYPAGDHFKSSDESQSTYWLRLMFVHERGDDLYLGRAIPRYWLTDGNSAGIERAASHFGPLSLRITSRADRGEIEAVLTPPERNRPRDIYLRLRHPQSRLIRSVTLNGEKHDRFDPQKEWIVLPGTVTGVQRVVARY